MFAWVGDHFASSRLLTEITSTFAPALLLLMVDTFALCDTCLKAITFIKRITVLKSGIRNKKLQRKIFKKSTLSYYFIK